MILSNKIDFEYMKVFTQAIKNPVIKDVVLYADEKISNKASDKSNAAVWKNK